MATTVNITLAGSLPMAGVTALGAGGTGAGGYNLFAASAPAYDPEILFSAGEQGAWFDPSDLSTMFQDAAGTTPVTADGQPVGLILDKSGRGNHASQSTTAKKPLYKTDGTYHWLQFDGVDDSLATSSIDLSTIDSVNIFSGVLKTSNAAIAILVDFNGAWANQNSFGLASTLTAGSAVAGMRSRGVGISPVVSTPFDINTLGVLTGLADISSDMCKIRVNQTEVSSSSDQGAGNYTNAVMNIGSGPGYYFHPGRIYSLIVRGAQSTAQEISDTEAWVNNKTGAF